MANANRTDPRLLLTCGLPGAGKTTLAAQLASERDALRLTKDEWLWAIGTTPWDTPTGARIEGELWRLARESLALGVGVVLDFGLWTRAERTEMRIVARSIGVGVELHYVTAPVGELWRRLEGRNARPPWNDCPIGRDDLDAWVERFETPDEAELALFDLPPD